MARNQRLNPPKNKIRNFEVNEPAQAQVPQEGKSESGTISRGVNTVERVKRGNIPNKKG